MAEGEDGVADGGIPVTVKADEPDEPVRRRGRGDGDAQGDCRGQTAGAACFVIINLARACTASSEAAKGKSEHPHAITCFLHPQPHRVHFSLPLAKTPPVSNPRLLLCSPLPTSIVDRVLVSVVTFFSAASFAPP